MAYTERITRVKERQTQAALPAAQIVEPLFQFDCCRTEIAKERAIINNASPCKFKLQIRPSSVARPFKLHTVWGKDMHRSFYCIPLFTSPGQQFTASQNRNQNPAATPDACPKFNSRFLPQPKSRREQYEAGPNRPASRQQSTTIFLEMQ